MTNTQGGPTTLQDVTKAIVDLRSMVGHMIKIRTVRGVRLKDGREMVTDAKQAFVLYDNGVQEEDDGGATLYVWDDIAEILV